MPNNHVGQHIRNYSWNIVNNIWLRAHGFPEHGTNVPNPNFVPLVRVNPEPGAPAVQAVWAPGWNQEVYNAAFLQQYGTLPQGQGGQPVQPSQPPQPPVTATEVINSWMEAPFNPYSFEVSWDSQEPKMVKAKSKNKIYNQPLNKIRRFKGGAKKGEIGLEIECEGMNLVQGMVDFWLCHTDNSLRHVKDHPPQEYVLREPISREDVPKALKYLSSKLKFAGSELVYSHRTSVHVHLNCQQLTMKQIYQVWCLYTIFEELLVEFSGPDRPGNLFCLSSKQAEYQVFTLQNSIIAESFDEVFNDNLRYTSCNVASLGKFGSLEFRSMRGTVDQGLIQSWVDILCLIKDKALGYKDPQEIVKDFQKLNSEAFMKKIFYDRQDLLAILGTYSDRHKKMWDGLRLMRDVAFAIEWEPVKEEPEEPKKSPEESEDGLESSGDVVNLVAGMYYKKYINPSEVDYIRQHLYHEYIFHEGDYWIVNYSPGPINIPRLNADGSIRPGTWWQSVGSKSLFSRFHSYMGETNATQQEIEIGTNL